MRGLLIALEGGEASGKSTQASRLAEHLGAVLTREPGGTAVGERIRELLLDAGAGAIDARAEVLLVAAARAQHVAEVIGPALDAGRHVVSDRFSGSSLAYQGHGRGLPIEDVQRVSAWATDGLEPDLVILLDVPDDVALARLGPDRDRLEAEDREFHRRVVAGFRALAERDAGRWVVVDGTGSPDEVAIRIRTAVDAMMQR